MDHVGLLVRFIPWASYRVHILHTHMYIYVCICVYIYTYIYIYTYMRRVRIDTPGFIWGLATEFNPQKILRCLGSTEQ